MTMMKSTSLGVLIALVGLFEGIAHSQESWILSRTPKPRGSIRILYASDHDNIRYILTDKPTPEQLRRCLNTRRLAERVWLVRRCFGNQVLAGHP